MEDSEPPDSRILTANLEEIQKGCELFLNLTEDFIEKNPKINKYNKTRYDALYKNLGEFYKMLINTSNLDLYSIHIQQRLYCAEKKEFALQAKNSLRNVLVGLDDLSHPDEESPFYEE